MTHSPVFTTGLTADGTDLTRTDLRILLRVTRGLFDGLEVRGRDTTVPGLAGQIPRNRLAHQRLIQAEGMVMGTGDPEAATETGGGANTTLTADAAIGDLTIDVASATGIAAGNLLRIGDPGETEVREVDSVVSLTVTLTSALGQAHDEGDQVREVDDTGSSPEADLVSIRRTIDALMRGDQSPYELVVTLEDGSTATIQARPLRAEWGDDGVPLYRQLVCYWVSVEPDWVFEPAP